LETEIIFIIVFFSASKTVIHYLKCCKMVQMHQSQAVLASATLF